MTSLGSALALAPPWWTALLLIPSNGVCKRAHARQHLVEVCVGKFVFSVSFLSLSLSPLSVLSLCFSIASCAGGVRIEWCSVLRK
jgi:hypothetical protein